MPLLPKRYLSPSLEPDPGNTRASILGLALLHRTTILGLLSPNFPLLFFFLSQLHGAAEPSTDPKTEVEEKWPRPADPTRHQALLFTSTHAVGDELDIVSAALDLMKERARRYRTQMNSFTNKMATWQRGAPSAGTGSSSWWRTFGSRAP